MQIEKCNAFVPDRITSIINCKGLKQCSVAEKAGYSVSEFNAMLNGRRIIKLCDVISIAKALGVNISELFKTD